MRWLKFLVTALVVACGTIDLPAQTYPSIFGTFNQAWNPNNPDWRKVVWQWQVFPGTMCYFVANLVNTHTPAHPSRLVLTAKDSGGTYQGGWLETANKQAYGSYRARFKISAPHPTDLNYGNCNAFFYYSNDAEIDMEFRTRWQGTIYTGLLDLVLHKNTLVGGHLYKVHQPLFLPFDPSLDYHEYGWDWRPNRVDFFVDGERVYSFAGTTQVPVPSTPGRFFLNNWSGNPIWGGKPTPGGDDFLVDWVHYSTCYFTADHPKLSVQQGGTSTLALEAGTANAGNLYVILPNVSGTNTGINLGSALIPVDFDPIMMIFLETMPSLIGQFDAAGLATNKSFSLPANSASAMVGVRFTMAYLVIDALTYTFKNASTPLSIRFVR